MNRNIDLRSDTVTRPTRPMLEAMLSAPVGDDVFDEDPTVHKLEANVASLLGKEAALFVPSGTMSNQIAIRCQTEPGDELLCEFNNHIIQYETGGPAVHSGVMCHTMLGVNGIIDVEHLEGRYKPVEDHLSTTKMVCLENTHNRGGGRIFPLENIQRIAQWTRKHNLVLHLDGARLWNAAVASGISLADWGAPFDSISVCFSKGLGAPVGSALVGSKALIKKARRVRKLFGGGMRQVGILAAGALYAVELQFQRLADDHRNAKRLGELVSSIPGLSLVPKEVETNILFVHLEPKLGTAKALVEKLKVHNILALSLSETSIRFVTHLDVTAEDMEVVGMVLKRVLS